jgi:hypothetical protein
MNPSINGTKARIYRVSATAEPHAFRNRLLDKESSYELVKEMKIQAVWYSHEELSQFDSMDRVQSSGYFILKNSHIVKLAIDPTPDGGNWNRYRFQFNINGTYSARYLEIVEMRPESPQGGKFRLWYAYFHEVRPEPIMSAVEQPTENPEDSRKPLAEMVDVIRRYE